MNLDKKELLKLKDLLEKDHYRIDGEVAKDGGGGNRMALLIKERAMVSNLIILTTNEIKDRPKMEREW